MLCGESPGGGQESIWQRGEEEWVRRIESVAGAETSQKVLAEARAIQGILHGTPTRMPALRVDVRPSTLGREEEDEEEGRVSPDQVMHVFQQVCGPLVTPPKECCWENPNNEEHDARKKRRTEPH